MVTSICADAALNLNIYVDLKNDFTIFVQFQFALNLLHVNGIGILCQCLNYPNHGLEFIVTNLLVSATHSVSISSQALLP